ncbi:hypothetical protein [Corynebacterium sp.]|uniref:hypothetical protein n=1 Tax=Corynebacterium sp. TaxID=1720 RepID=UPI0026DCCD69|nr:hypothetical protein [Corynebacterium sp.]MDO4914306.1 hypothetical protein [Corynebacterium sp.]
MTRYFTALMVYMYVFSIVGITFDGFDSKEGAITTALLSSAAAFVVYFLYPIFRRRDK